MNSKFPVRDFFKKGGSVSRKELDLLAREAEINVKLLTDAIDGMRIAASPDGLYEGISIDKDIVESILYDEETTIIDYKDDQTVSVSEYNLEIERRKRAENEKVAILAKLKAAATKNKEESSEQLLRRFENFCAEMSKQHLEREKVYVEEIQEYKTLAKKYKLELINYKRGSSNKILKILSSMNKRMAEVEYNLAINNKILSETV